MNVYQFTRGYRVFPGIFTGSTEIYWDVTGFDG